MLGRKGTLIITTRFLKIMFNFCYLESQYLAEIIISTGVPNPLEIKVAVENP